MKKECILYKELKKDLLQCTCCSHYCTIKKGNTGKCGIRQNIDGKLFLLTYGQALGLNVDPIEKKPLFHFLPGSKVFSFGTAGCNFTCTFCQNYQMSQMKLKNTPEIEGLGINLSPEKAVKYCLDHNIPSIAFTYNEPTIFFEYAFDIMNLAKKKGIKTVFVSNGFQTKEFWEKSRGLIDAINIDLKGFSEEFYTGICGGKLDPILKNIEYVYKNTDIHLEITTLIVPWENDSDDEIRKMARFLKNISPDIPWHISGFHPDYKMLDHPSTSIDTLRRAYEIGKEEGMNYIYIGNVLDPKHEATYCPNCSEVLIERRGYIGDKIKIHWSKSGICNKCNEKVPGIWK